MTRQEEAIKSIEDLMRMAEKTLRDALWAAEEARASLIRLHVQKDMLVLGGK